MIELYAAIITKVSGSDLSTAVGGRIYSEDAPDGAALPYVIFIDPLAEQRDTFSERIEDISLQFSAFSDSTSTVEIGGIYDNIRSLFDDATLSVSGWTNIMTVFESRFKNIERTSTETGEAILRHWDVNYRLVVQEN